MKYALPVELLIGGFALLTGVVLIVALAVGWRVAIRRMTHNMTAEVAYRREAVAAIEHALTHCTDAGQAGRLRDTLAFHRAALRGLDPHGGGEVMATRGAPGAT